MVSASFRTLFLSRLIPFLFLLIGTYIVPWFQRTYLITGFSGANFQQTDVSQCDIIYPDKLIGCEDLHVYSTDSGHMIFAGCAENLQDQFTWFPGITARNKSRAGHYEGPFYVYEPAKDKLARLTVQNFPENTDMVWHGFDIFETSPGNLLIYAINHRRTGSMIERFHHTVGSGTLVYERSFDCHNDIVYTPNDVAVIGKDEFYVTNDHMAVEGIIREVGDYLRLPLSTVAFHHRTQGLRKVAKGIRSANGILSDHARKRIIVSEILGGNMLVYQYNDEGDLKLIQEIELDFLPDNPSLTPGGDLLVTGVPSVRTALNHDPSVIAHSKVVRIATGQIGDAFFGAGSGQTTKPIIEPVLMDYTGKVNASTTAVEVAYGGDTWLFTTSWRAEGLTRCKLS